MLSGSGNDCKKTERDIAILIMIRINKMTLIAIVIIIMISIMLILLTKTLFTAISENVFLMSPGYCFRHYYYNYCKLFTRVKVAWL